MEISELYWWAMLTEYIRYLFFGDVAGNVDGDIVERCDVDGDSDARFSNWVEIPAVHRHSCTSSTNNIHHAHTPRDHAVVIVKAWQRTNVKTMPTLN